MSHSGAAKIDLATRNVDDTTGFSSIIKYLMPADINGARSKAIWAQIEPHLDDILDNFYRRLAKAPEMAAKLGNVDEAIAKFGKMQASHWESVFNGDTDYKFAAQSRKVGSAHVRIGLTSDWFIASYGRIMMDAVPAVLKAHRFTPHRATEAIQVLLGRLFLDMALANESYSSQITDQDASEWREDNDYQNLKTISGAITNLNKTTLALAILGDSAKRTTSSSQSVAAAVEQLVASIQQLSDSSQSAAREAQDTNVTLRQGVDGVMKAQKAITTVSEAADQSTESLSSLQSAADEISAFMNVIQSISDQTNLLALNATIEAARAGEAGKGFAVVASEVKALATQAAKASEDVALRIRTLQDGIDRISANFTETRKAISVGAATLDDASDSIETAGTQMNSVASRMEEMAQILDQQEDSAREISVHVSGIADRSTENSDSLSDISTSLQASNDQLSEAAQKWFRNTSGRSLCEMAKIDHVLFKKRVVDAILGRGAWKSSDVPDNHMCRLGKWYDSVQDADLKAQPSFINLLNPHQRVHTAAINALKSHERGDMEAAIAGLKAVDDASQEVINSLNDVSDYLHSRESISERRKKDRQAVFGEPVEIRNNSKNIKTHVIDEGPRGIGVEGVNRNDVGEVFDLNYRGDKKGIVRWSDGKRGGIEFKD